MGIVRVIDGCGASDPVETGVLLGRLDLTLSDAAAPIQFDFGEEAAPAASHDGRPYLLQTQAIQELLFLGGDDDEEQLAEVKVFAVPSIEIEENTVFIRLWFPYNGPIVLDETSLMIWDDSVDQEIDFRVEPSENRDVHVWRLELLFPRDSEPEDPLAWALERLRSARLLFNFHGHLTSVEIDEQVSMSLIDAMIQEMCIRDSHYPAAARLRRPGALRPGGAGESVAHGRAHRGHGAAGPRRAGPQTVLGHVPCGRGAPGPGYPTGPQQSHPPHRVGRLVPAGRASGPSLSF